MKYMVSVPDLDGRSDGLAFNMLQRVDVDVPIILVSRVEDMKLNDRLLKLKDYVLIDYVENGWDWSMDYGHQWGKNTDKFCSQEPTNNYISKRTLTRRRNR